MQYLYLLFSFPICSPCTLYPIYCILSLLCFPHFQLVRLEELLCFQHMENTKVTPVKITVASLLCFPHFELVMLEGRLCFQHFQLVLLEELLCFPYIENTKAPSNQQKSQKVLLLCFVTFVTFVFYAHPTKVLKGVTFVFCRFCHLCVLCSPLESNFAVEKDDIQDIQAENHWNLPEKCIFYQKWDVLDLLYSKFEFSGNSRERGCSWDLI